MADERENQLEHIDPPRVIDTSWLPAPDATEVPRSGYFSSEEELQKFLSDDEGEPDSGQASAVEGDEPEAVADGEVEPADAVSPEGDSSITEGAEPAEAGDAVGDTARQDQGDEVAPVSRWQESDIAEYEDEAIRLISAIVKGDGDPLEFLKVAAEISPANTRGILNQELEAEAEEFVAAKYKLTPEVLAERLGESKPVVLSDRVKAALAQLPDEVSKEIESAYKEKQKTEQERDSVRQQLDGVYQYLSEQREREMSRTFESDFYTIEDTVTKRLVKADEGTQESVMNSAHVLFGRSPEAEALVDAYENSVRKGEPLKRQENHKKAIAAHFEKMVRRELATRKMRAADEGKPRLEDASKKTKTAPKTQGAVPPKKATTGTKAGTFNPKDYVGKNILDLTPSQQEAVLQLELAMERGVTA